MKYEIKYGVRTVVLTKLTQQKEGVSSLTQCAIGTCLRTTHREACLRVVALPIFDEYSHHYQLGKSTFAFRGVRSDF